MSEGSEGLIGTFTDPVALHDLCVDRIDAGDLDFDDWVYRSRDTCSGFLDSMYEIGWAYQPPRAPHAPRRPRRGMKWIYTLATKPTS